MKKIRLCPSCGSYTLDQTHCGTASKSAHPPQYKPEDKWAKYRRIANGLA